MFACRWHSVDRTSQREKGKMERGEALEKDKSGLRVMMKTKTTLAEKIQNTFQQIFCKYENKSASYGPLGILIKLVETCSETL